MDSSGLRVWLTASTAGFEAETIHLEVNVNDIFIPPKAEEFRVYGICAMECTKKVLQQLTFSPQPICITL